MSRKRTVCTVSSVTVALAAVTGLTARVPAQPPLSAFLPAVIDSAAFGTQLGDNKSTATPEDCAAHCLQVEQIQSQEVVSMNFCGHGVSKLCQCSGWGVAYDLQDNRAGCQWYRRSIARNETAVQARVAVLARVPDRGVALGNASLLSKAFKANIEYLRLRADVDAMLYRFRLRKDAPCHSPKPAGYCFGWDCSLAPDYAASGFIMGVGASLRWLEDVGLQSTLERLLQELATCSNDNGWFLPWSESEMAANWYSTSGMNVITEALIEADGVVSHDVMVMLRQIHDAYVNHTRLPVNLPANGGPDPVEPLAAGFDNVTSCGHGTDKHNIYFQYTALHHNGATARSSVGIQEDVDLMEKLYIEDWWITALAERDEWHGIWHRNFFTHNYEVRGLTGLVDLYVVTGNRTYLDAALGGWTMLRESWMHVGGSLAINEEKYYPPKSYYISYTGRGQGKLEPPPGDYSLHLDRMTAQENLQQESAFTEYPITVAESINGFRLKQNVFCDRAPKANGVHTENASDCAALVPRDAYGFQFDCDGKREANACIVLHTIKECGLLQKSSCGSEVYIRSSRPDPKPAPPEPQPPWPEGTDYPTGELCGSLNTKLHALAPNNESFAAEIERTILNVAMAAIDGDHNGHPPTGIRYFQNMHKQKQFPTRVASCCENHGTHLLGALPQHIFSMPPEINGSVTGTHINFFAAARLSMSVLGSTGAHVNTSVSIKTEWPIDPLVSVAVDAESDLESFDLAIRIPSWVNTLAVRIAVNGSQRIVDAQLGSYAHLIYSPWPSGRTQVNFELPMTLQAHRYVGADQFTGLTRYAFTVGPILLAATGPTGRWNSTLDCLHIRRVDPTQPTSWLLRLDPKALHYYIDGQDVIFKPYYAVNGNDTYATYPAFDM